MRILNDAKRRLFPFRLLEHVLCLRRDLSDDLSKTWNHKLTFISSLRWGQTFKHSSAQQVVRSFVYSNAFPGRYKLICFSEGQASWLIARRSWNLLFPLFFFLFPHTFISRRECNERKILAGIAHLTLQAVNWVIWDCKRWQCSSLTSNLLRKKLMKTFRDIQKL